MLKAQGDVVNDFYKRIVDPSASEKRLVLVGRIASAALLVAAGLFALLLESAIQGFNILLSIGIYTISGRPIISMALPPDIDHLPIRTHVPGMVGFGIAFRPNRQGPGQIAGEAVHEIAIQPGDEVTAIIGFGVFGGS